MDQDDTMSSYSCDRCGQPLDIGYRYSGDFSTGWRLWATCTWCQLGVQKGISFDGPDLHPDPVGYQQSIIESKYATEMATAFHDVYTRWLADNAHRQLESSR